MDNLPPAITREFDGAVWIKQLDPDQYVTLGYAPIPATRWQAFWYHVGHGLIMHYPLPSILRFAWHNRDSFEKPVLVELTLSDGD